MSSFVHSPKHFASVEQGIWNLLTRDSFYLTKEMRAIYPKLATRGAIGLKDVAEALAPLRELNVVCVSLQYAHSFEPGGMATQIAADMKEIKRKVIGLDLNPTETYKAMCSIRYQIELEHLTDIRALNPEEQAAWSYLNLMIPHVAEWIVSNSDAYDNAREAWSI